MGEVQRCSVSGPGIAFGWWGEVCIYVLGDKLSPGIYPSLVMELGWEARVLSGVVNINYCRISWHFVYTFIQQYRQNFTWNVDPNHLITKRSSLSYDKEAVISQTAWTRSLNPAVCPESGVIVHQMLFIYIYLVYASLQYNWPFSILTLPYELHRTYQSDMQLSEMLLFFFENSRQHFTGAQNIFSLLSPFSFFIKDKSTWLPSVLRKRSITERDFEPVSGQMGNHLHPVG